MKRTVALFQDSAAAFKFPIAPAPRTRLSSSGDDVRSPLRCSPARKRTADASNATTTTMKRTSTFTRQHSDESRSPLRYSPAQKNALKTFKGVFGGSGKSPHNTRLRTAASDHMISPMRQHAQPRSPLGLARSPLTSSLHDDSTEISLDVFDNDQEGVVRVAILAVVHSVSGSCLNVPKCRKIFLFV